MAKYLTKQRRQLICYLEQHTDELLTAQDISQALDGISVSAVYRNLSAMEEDGLLKRSVRENTREAFYQYIAAPICKNSLHLSCRVCGRSIHLGNQETQQLLDSAMQTTGFRIDKSETILYGICADCQQ